MASCSKGISSTLGPSIVRELREADNRRLLREAELDRERMVLQLKRALGEWARLNALAVEASQARDEFLPVLCHELRNPLAPIVSAIQRIRSRTKGALSREE